MILQVTNPFQSPANFVKLTNANTNCCEGKSAQCRNAFQTEYGKLGQIQFTVNCRGKEESYSVDVSSATNQQELIDLICEKACTMIPEGGFGGTIGKGSTPVEVLEDGTDITVCIDTDINITGHLDSDGVVGEIEKTCTKKTVYKVQHTFVKDAAAASVLEYNGNSVNLGPYPAGSTALQADLVTALGVLGLTGDVVVTESEDGTKCFADITSEATASELTLDGEAAQPCAVLEVWDTPKEDLFAPMIAKAKADKKFGPVGQIQNFPITQPKK